MGGEASKPTTSKTETNVSLVQFHWTSFGIGASSIILGILALGLITLILFYCKARCTKMFNTPPGPNYGYNP